MSYSILLVDDEQPSVEAMCNGIKWEDIKIEKVYTAFNASQARRVLTNHSIDLIVCDIEMPQEDGLSLIHWVHENHADIINILLTCHADFSYAQRSVKAGVFDYLLKPTPYDEMESTISRAITQLETQRLKKKYEQTLNSKKSIIFNRFLLDLLKGEFVGNQDEIINQAKQWDLAIDIDKEYLFLLFSTRKKVSQDDIQSVKQNIKQFLMENFPPTIREIYILPSQENETIILMEYPPDMDWKEIKESCRCFIWQLAVNLENKPCLYCAHPRTLAQLSSSYESMQERKRTNIAYDGIAYFEDEQYEMQGEELDFDWNGWKELLLRGQGEKLYDMLCKHIHQQVSARKLNEDKLLIFYHNFIQLLYSTLSEKQISVKSVFTNRQILTKYRENFTKVEEMLEYIHEVILTSVDLMNQSSNKDSVIKRVEEYVQLHICEEISRDEVADYVYLNSEYLSRLFRKETGLSLKEYITNLKVQKAKEMFLTTNLQVTEVACQVGYTNLPYFSKVFKESTGMSPNEFRKGK